MDDKKRSLLEGIGLSDEMIDRAAVRDAQAEDLPRHFPPGEHEFDIERVRQILNNRETVMVCFEGRCADSSVRDLVGKKVAYYAVFRYGGEISAEQLAEVSGDASVARCVAEAAKRHLVLGKLFAVDLQGKTLREVDAMLGHKNTAYEVRARVHVSASEKPLRRDPTRSIVLCKFSAPWHRE